MIQPDPTADGTDGTGWNWMELDLVQLGTWKDPFSAFILTDQS
jgi:hypothetical protein